MPGPLAGVRVLDFTLALAGPFGGMLLADLGADVIKIESPDPEVRGSGGLAHLKGENSHFLVVNRNKRGFSVDMKSPKGQEAFHRLVKTADVLVQNWRFEGGKGTVTSPGAVWTACKRPVGAWLKR